MNLPGDYDAWLQRGSGVYSDDWDVELSEPCPRCGSLDGTGHKDDYGVETLWCVECDEELTDRLTDHAE